MAVSFSIVYILFSEYREEEFQQQQKEKIKYTIRFMADYKAMSENLAEIMDELTIHDFYDEKMLVFDADQQIIFSSIDDLPIPDYEKILENISPETQWFETKDGDYDIVAIYTENNGQSYYAISKAYDAFGYTKMNFLRYVLVAIFFTIAIVVIFISLFLSNKISKPITLLADNLNKYDLSSERAQEIVVETSSYELKQLTTRFNDLLRRTNKAFAFQKHTVHHISHQLKTPIAVLVSELEKVKNLSTMEDVNARVQNQVIKAKSLGGIIDVLLEISKIEAGQEIRKTPTRIDEMIFDIIEELNIIYPEFHFELNYMHEEMDESKLIVNLNLIMMRQAMQNLLINCIAYSSNSKAEIKLDSSCGVLTIRIINFGKAISITEQQHLFNHFFRGENSLGKQGFGLGLVLTKKIIELNSATIAYFNPEDNVNIFEVCFP